MIVTPNQIYGFRGLQRGYSNAPKGIIDNLTNLTEDRKRTEQFCPVRQII